MNNNFPCICGHDKIDHLNVDEIIGGKHFDFFCDACAMDTNRIENWMPAYHNFKGNNLRYLESKACK
jgi:hypothetical protein